MAATREQHRGTAEPRAVAVLGVLAVLVAAAFAVPHVFDWSVDSFTAPPLLAHGDPRFGPGTVAALALGALAVLAAPRLTAQLPWRPLLGLTYVAGAAWSYALITVDGAGHLGSSLSRHSEYLRSSRSIADIGALLRGYIDRIPLHSPHAFPVQLAGHPPGAVLVFIGLDRLGISSDPAVGAVLLLAAATTPLAVLVTLRVLGAEPAARRIAALLAIGPAAIWQGATADGMFAAILAWGLCALAVAATRCTAARAAAWSVPAGLVLGYGLLLSYGYVLIGLIALAVLLAARNWRPLAWGLPAALAVVVVFAAAGFAWWDAYPVLRTRYFAGISRHRPDGYWIWADLAAFAVCCGPALAGALAVVGRVRRPAGRTPELVLGAAGLLCVLIADLSLMSKAEVERIWLPFVPWALLPAAALSARWRRATLGGAVLAAVLIRSLLNTYW